MEGSPHKKIQYLIGSSWLCGHFLTIMFSRISQPGTCVPSRHWGSTVPTGWPFHRAWPGLEFLAQNCKSALHKMTEKSFYRKRTFQMGSQGRRDLSTASIRNCTESLRIKNWSNSIYNSLRLWHFLWINTFFYTLLKKISIKPHFFLKSFGVWALSAVKSSLLQVIFHWFSPLPLSFQWFYFGKRAFPCSRKSSRSQEHFNLS